MARIAVVTGASSGLGRGLALALADEGWQVALMARRTERLEEVASAIRKKGGHALPLTVDVADREAVLAATERVVAELGTPELLVANAGMGDRTTPQRFDGARIERLLRVNLFGAIYGVEGCIAGMLERGNGHLVAISSVAGFRGLPGAAAYSASKAAMTTFFEALRVDLRGSGVDVTVVHPGWVKTPMTEEVRHPMPFIMEEAEAVRIIMRGLRARRRVVSFPLPLVAILYLGRLLPAFLYDALAGWGRGGRSDQG